MPAARKPQPQPHKERAKLTVPRTEFDQQLQERIYLGEKLLGNEIQSLTAYEEVRSRYRIWDEFNATLIESAFTTSEEANTYKYWGVAFGTDDLRRRIALLIDDIKERIRRLDSLKERLSLFPEIPTLTAPTMPTKAVATEQAVFIVHGRDDGPKHKVARLVQDVTGVRPVILDEQEKLGKTIIEKLEEHAYKTSFAVILLTGDDEGRLKGAVDLQPRARQNVILELGLFIGAIKRSNVAILYERGVELPSDIGGLLFIEYDSGDGWKFKLAKEMRAAGLSVDMNKLD
jgi:predicted nucleotide-binding protein